MSIGDEGGVLSTNDMAGVADSEVVELLAIVVPSILVNPEEKRGCLGM